MDLIKALAELVKVLPVVELVQLGAAGLCGLTILCAFLIILVREVRFVWLVPPDKTVHQPNNELIHLFTKAGVRSALLVVGATIFQAIIAVVVSVLSPPPPQKVDLSPEITALRSLSQSLETQRDIAAKMAQGMTPIDDQALEAQGTFKYMVVDLSDLLGEARGAADRLMSKSTVDPIVPTPKPPRPTAFPPAARQSLISAAKCDLNADIALLEGIVKKLYDVVEEPKAKPWQGVKNACNLGDAKALVAGLSGMEVLFDEIKKGHVALDRSLRFKTSVAPTAK